MFGSKTLRKLKKSTPMREAEKIEYDDQGNAIINVGLKELEDFFYPCSFKTYDMVSKDVIEYVEMFAGQVPQKENLSIDIYTEEPTDNFDKKRIRRAVKRHYAEKIFNQSKSMKKDILWGSILMLLGVLVAMLEFVVL